MPQGNTIMNVEDLIKKIELRPGMYVGTPSLEAIFYFINGYLYNTIESNRADSIDIRFKNSFHSWVKASMERKYFIKFDEQRNYVFYIQQVFKNNEDQINEFFKLCHAFFEEEREVSISGQDEGNS